MGAGVGFENVSVEASARGYGKSIVQCPRADPGGILPRPRRAGFGACAPHILLQVLTQFSGVPGGEIDFVVPAVHAELQRFIGRCSVQVVNQDDLYFLGHGSFPGAS